VPFERQPVGRPPSDSERMPGSRDEKTTYKTRSRTTCGPTGRCKQDVDHESRRPARSTADKTRSHPQLRTAQAKIGDERLRKRPRPWQEPTRLITAESPMTTAGQGQEKYSNRSLRRLRRSSRLGLLTNARTPQERPRGGGPPLSPYSRLDVVRAPPARTTAPRPVERSTSGRSRETGSRSVETDRGEGLRRLVATWTSCRGPYPANFQLSKRHWEVSPLSGRTALSVSPARSRANRVLGRVVTLFRLALRCGHPGPGHLLVSSCPARVLLLPLFIPRFPLPAILRIALR
jgi:hypothetical protein